MTDIISKAEMRFDGDLSAAADRILLSKCNTVLVAGGSCAGKTTTVRLLAAKLLQRGRRSYTISLDDFYRFGDEIIYLPDGTPDFESVDSLRTDLVQKCLRQINERQSVHLPYFDFMTKVRHDDYKVITPNDKDIFIIEGLHAHNPSLVGESEAFKLYLYADADVKYSEYIRLVRRIVRDIRFRGTGAYDNFLHWDKVIAEEEKSIAKFASDADLLLNTYHSYERMVFAAPAREAMRGIDVGSVFMPLKSVILCYLGDAEIPVSAVPENSLLKEFV